MPSNSLSERRGLLRRPIVCKKAPPKIPPPPAAWPPDSFNLDFEYVWEDIDGQHTTSWSLLLTRDPATWIWSGVETPPLQHDATWSINQPLQTATLSINVWTNDIVDGHAELFNIAVTWNTPTIYVITAWDTLSSNMLSAKATFTF